MLLHNIIWKVTDKELQTPIIGLRSLASLGCENRKMLIAARNKLGDDIGVKQRLTKDDENEEEIENIIADLYGEPSFHNGGQIEDDGSQNEDVYVDFGDDLVEELEK